MYITTDFLLNVDKYFLYFLQQHFNIIIINIVAIICHIIIEKENIKINAFKININSLN